MLVAGLNNNTNSQSKLCFKFPDGAPLCDNIPKRPPAPDSLAGEQRVNQQSASTPLVALELKRKKSAGPVSDGTATALTPAPLRRSGGAEGLAAHVGGVREMSGALLPAPGPRCSWASVPAAPSAPLCSIPVVSLPRAHAACQRRPPCWLCVLLPSLLS